jgi:hypothetical protein
MSYLDGKIGQEPDEDTLVVPSKQKGNGTGRLVVTPNGDTPRQEFTLNEGAHIVGRRAKVTTADICIETGDKSMSRNHIRIDVKKNAKGSGFFHSLSDNNSKNHTLYNGKRIEDGDIVVLKDNDEIVLGRTIIRFYE